VSSSNIRLVALARRAVSQPARGGESCLGNEHGAVYPRMPYDRCEPDLLRLGHEIELHDADLLQTGHGPSYRQRSTG
jgi:hypothetical protein